MSLVLITGSCGLVGSESSIFFAEKGLEILGIDNNSRKSFFGQDGDIGWVKNKLKRDIVVESSNQKTTVEQIWGSVTSAEANAERDKFSRPASQDPDGKELLDQTIKDCSSSRMRDVDE